MSSPVFLTGHESHYRHFLRRAPLVRECPDHSYIMKMACEKLWHQDHPSPLQLGCVLVYQREMEKPLSREDDN